MPITGKVEKEQLQGKGRSLTKRYLRLFIERIVINPPQLEIAGKSDVVPAVLITSLCPIDHQNDFPLIFFLQIRNQIL